MALGALTILEKTVGQGPLGVARFSLVGDGTYPAGGSTGLLALLRAALGGQVNLICLKDEGTLADAMEYIHATDRLLIRVKATGVESAVSNQAGVTYQGVAFYY